MISSTSDQRVIRPWGMKRPKRKDIIIVLRKRGNVKKKQGWKRERLSAIIEKILNEVA